MLVNDLHELLFTSPGPSPKNSLGKWTSRNGDAYSKTHFSECGNDPAGAFKKFYMFIFELAKSNEARNVDIEIATALWSTVLAVRYPMCEDLVEFINTKKTYKGVNKDIWSMTLEFCGEVERDQFDSYESDGAWPTMMDDFVTFRKEQLEKQNKVNNEDET